MGPGAKPGLFFPALALISPGDEVVYPDPVGAETMLATSHKLFFHETCYRAKCVG